MHTLKAPIEKNYRCSVLSPPRECQLEGYFFSHRNHMRNVKGLRGWALGGLTSLEYPFVAYSGQNEARSDIQWLCQWFIRFRSVPSPCQWSPIQTNLTDLSSESWLLTTTVCWNCLLGMTNPGAATILNFLNHDLTEHFYFQLLQQHRGCDSDLQLL